MKFDVMPVATEKQIIEIEEAANHVWHNYYRDIFSPQQIDYMLKKYQSKDALKRQMSDGYIYFMLISDGHFAGYMCYKLNSDHIFISRLYIKAEYRRQGLAKKTINRLEDLFKTADPELENIKKLKLNVERNNHFAINVYEHLGFIRTKAVDNDIGNGFVCKEYVMERRIVKDQVNKNG